MKEIINDWKFVILMSLTLGLAPFTPEPHILGKIRWIWGGAVGMRFIDWFDVVMHGTPFVLLIRLAVIKMKEQFSG